VNPDQQTASHADANSANGAFRPTRDFPANWRPHQFGGSGTAISEKAHGKKDLRQDHLPAITLTPGEGSRASAGGYPVAKRQLAPATQGAHPGNSAFQQSPDIPGEWRWRQLPARSPLKSGKSFG
jgi:hypothetical protein